MHLCISGFLLDEDEALKSELDLDGSFTEGTLNLMGHTGLSVMVDAVWLMLGEQIAQASEINRQSLPTHLIHSLVLRLSERSQFL